MTSTRALVWPFLHTTTMIQNKNERVPPELPKEGCGYKPNCHGQLRFRTAAQLIWTTSDKCGYWLEQCLSLRVRCWLPPLTQQREAWRKDSADRSSSLLLEESGLKRRRAAGHPHAALTFCSTTLSKAGLSPGETTAASEPCSAHSDNSNSVHHTRPTCGPSSPAEGSLLQDQASSGAATYLTLKCRHPACPSPQQQQKHHTKLKPAPHPKPPEWWHSEALFSLPSSWLQHILLYHFSSFWYSKPNNLPAGLVNYRELAAPKVLCYRDIIQAANC